MSNANERTPSQKASAFKRLVDETCAAIEDQLWVAPDFHGYKERRATPDMDAIARAVAELRAAAMVQDDERAAGFCEKCGMDVCAHAMGAVEAADDLKADLERALARVVELQKRPLQHKG